MSQNGETRFSEVPPFNCPGEVRPIEAAIKRPNPIAVKSIPIPILRGADGSFPLFRSQVKNPIITGVRNTINMGLNC